MGIAAAAAEEPILSRIDRLDNMKKLIQLRQLEEIRGYNNRSAKSSCASTPTSASEGRISSVDLFSPKSLEKHCRPIENVMMETEAKGMLIERLNHVEDRMLKVCLQVEQWEAQKKREEKKVVTGPKKKGGFKQLVKQCMKSKGKHDKKQQ